MKVVRGFGVGLVFQIALTFAVAWAGRFWIPGFDLRGPFLVMSPMFAVGVFFIVTAIKIFGPVEEDGVPEERNAKLIQEVSLEFGFGSVVVKQKRVGSGLALFLVPWNGNNYDLPKEWDKFDEDARRFAVVRLLASIEDPSVMSYLRRSPAYSCQVVGMVAAGWNLWTILGYHCFVAAYLAYIAVWRRERFVTDQDKKALRIMKDLPAAISFVKVDESNRGLEISVGQRITALNKEAARLGIA